MRTTCNSISDFLENLKDAGDIFLGTVYVSRSPRQISEVCKEIVIQVSAVIDLGDQGQYLLEGAETCGRDYTDASQDFGGTERFEELREEIKSNLPDGVRIKPGIVDI